MIIQYPYKQPRNEIHKINHKIRMQGNQWQCHVLHKNTSISARRCQKSWNNGGLTSTVHTNNGQESLENTAQTFTGQ